MPSPIDDEILQRFHDGDLSPAEARGVSLRIAGDPDAQRRLRELRALGDLVRDAAHQATEALDSDALFRSIEARLPQRAAPSIMPPQPSNVRPLRRRSGWVPGLATTAVAAAALLAVLRTHEPPAGSGEAKPQAEAPVTYGEATSALNKHNDEDEGGQLEPEPAARLGATEDALAGEDEPALVSTMHGSQLERVDFGRNAGTAFVMEGAGFGVTVVWLNEPSDGDAP